MKCPKCKTSISDDSHFCSKCGTQLISLKDVSITKTLKTTLPSFGKTIAGKYEIIFELGRGGMGIVYKAKDNRLECDEKDNVADFMRFFKSALEKDRKKALKALTGKLKNFDWQDPEFLWLMASCFAMIDEKDQTLKWLEHAIERGWINFPLFAKIDPFLENIRGEPRFKKLMDRIKYEWDNFEI